MLYVDIKEMKILIVEDNRINQAVLLGVLSNKGLSADVAGNGIEALSALNGAPDNAPYQLIIMDCQMPKMDGYEATKAIRSGKAKQVHCDVPIIAMTANTMKGDRDKCIAVGMTDYTTKPVDADILHEKIANCVGRDLGKPESNKISQQSVLPTPEKKGCCKSSEGNDIEKNNSLSIDKSIVWDKDGFLKRIRNNEKLAKQLISLFIKDMPALQYELIEAMRSENFDDIVAFAHKMKGSSRNLGGNNLADIAREIEKSARIKNSNEILSLQSDLTNEFEVLIQVLNEFL